MRPWPSHYLDPKQGRYGLNDAEGSDPGRIGRIPKDRNSRHLWCNLLQQLQPFGTHAEVEIHETGSIAAWPRETLHDAGTDRIGNHREYDRHTAGGLQ